MNSKKQKRAKKKRGNRGKKHRKHKKSKRKEKTGTTKKTDRVLGPTTTSLSQKKLSRYKSEKKNTSLSLRIWFYLHMTHIQFPLDVLSEGSRLHWEASMWRDSSFRYFLFLSFDVEQIFILIDYFHNLCPVAP